MAAAESESRLEALRELWPAPHRRTFAAEVELAREAYGLEASDVLLLKAASYGLDRKESAAITGFPADAIRKRWPQIQSALRAKNQAQAVCNALRVGLIS